MTDQEFDVLDELYFVQSFDEIRQATALEPEPLRRVLQDLLEKGWIRCMSSRGEDEEGKRVDFQAHYDKYFYLATKAGLMSHNSR